MVEGNRFEDEVAGRGDGVTPGHRAAGGALIAEEVADGHHPAHRRQRGGDLGRLGAPVDPPPGPVVPVRDEQHGRLDLGEAVDHALRAVIRRDARPHCPHAGRGQQPGHRFGSVGQVGRHPVTRPDPPRPQAVRQAGH